MTVDRTAHLWAVVQKFITGEGISEEVAAETFRRALECDLADLGIAANAVVIHLMHVMGEDPRADPEAAMRRSADVRLGMLLGALVVTGQLP